MSKATNTAEATSVNTDVQVEKAKVKTIQLSKAQQAKFDSLTSISAKIRYLAAEGFSTNENKYGMIARFMDKRTQHVRNVLTQPLKKA